jgi:phosphoglycerol geranylgeranyltransferase
MFYESFIKKSSQPQIAVLIDPEKSDAMRLKTLIAIAEACDVDWFFVGGSTVKKEDFDSVVSCLKRNSSISVVIFPGDSIQINSQADAILFLSLVSGRNPEYLIGQQVKASKKILDMNLPVIPTGYILVDGGKESATAKVTQTRSLSNKDEIVATAIAAEMMGMKAIYLEAGSGANQSVSLDIIAEVKNHCISKLIVGGGIKTAKQASDIIATGADIIVIGNILEKDPEILAQICREVKEVYRK